MDPVHPIPAPEFWEDGPSGRTDGCPSSRPTGGGRRLRFEKPFDRGLVGGRHSSRSEPMENHEEV